VWPKHYMKMITMVKKIPQNWAKLFQLDFWFEANCMLSKVSQYLQWFGNKCFPKFPQVSPSCDWYLRPGGYR
jgi:hypothetical protein